jgi:diaminohydroxyphosphoribosylaminopyrimidine deaminase/5-amino-6-(5-phosphoribosylamino)uracil reductase
MHWLQATSGTQREGLLEKAFAAGKPLYHRIVLDSRGRTPLGSRLVKTAREVKTVIAVAPDAPPRRCRRLEESGCEVVCCRSHGGRVDIEDLLGMLGKRRLTNLLVEGGSAVLGAFFDAGAVDQVMVFIAPKIVGGSGAVGAMGGAGAEKVTESLKMMDVKVGRSGEDVWIEGYTREAAEYLRV